MIRSSLSPNTCLRWTEKREKVTPILQADHRLKKGTVGFKSGITPDCFFSPFKHKKSSPFRSPKVRFAAVVNPNCKDKSVFYSRNH